MRILITFLFLFFTSSTLFARSISWVPFGKAGILPAYKSKAECEKIEKRSCFDTKLRSIDILKKSALMPAVKDSVDCKNSADCQSQIDDKSFKCSKGTPSFDDKINWPTLDFASAGRPTKNWFLWCHQETLAIDSAKKAAHDTALANKAKDKSDRVAKATARDTVLKNCVKVALKGVPDLDPGTALPADLAKRQNKLKDCLGALLKEVISSRLSVDDL